MRVCACLRLCVRVCVFFYTQFHKSLFSVRVCVHPNYQSHVAMNWTHPFMLLAYATLVLVFVCMIANRSKQTYTGPKAAKYFMNQAKSANWGQVHGKPSLELLKRVRGLVYVQAARKLSSDMELHRSTGVDPVQLQQQLGDCEPLCASFGILPDEFKTLLA